MSTESIVTLLLSIPLSILVALIMPTIQDWLSSVSLPVRERRIKAILQEYVFIASLRKDLRYFIGVLFKRLAYIMIFLFTLAAGVILTLMSASLYSRFPDTVTRLLFYSTYVFSVTSFGYGAMRCFALIRLVNQVNYLGTYEKEVRKRVEKLGGIITELAEDGFAFSTKEDLRK